MDMADVEIYSQGFSVLHNSLVVSIPWDIEKIWTKSGLS
jgi:hypothetical protein